MNETRSHSAGEACRCGDCVDCVGKFFSLFYSVLSFLRRFLLECLVYLVLGGFRDLWFLWLRRRRGWYVWLLDGILVAKFRFGLGRVGWIGRAFGWRHICRCMTMLSGLSGICRI